jgi:hypothetical protein
MHPANLCRMVLCLLALATLCLTPTIAPAQSSQVLGGTLRWSESTSAFNCPHSATLQYSQTFYSSFTWQYGGTTYPVSGSPSYIAWAAGDTHPPCPPQGAEFPLQYTIPSGLGFPANCSFTFAATVDGAGSVATQNCGGSTTWPTPPPSAVKFQNLQTVQHWKVCEGTCPINGVNSGPPTDNGSISFGISSPSLSGSAMAMQDQSVDPYFDVLYSLDDGGELDQGLTLGCSSSPCKFQNFEDDLWFYIPSSSLASIENLEFDPDYTDQFSNRYRMSVECTSSHNSGHPNHWQYWKESQGVWIDTSVDCSSVWSNVNQWQHLQIYTYLSTPGQSGTPGYYRYGGVLYNGSNQFANLTIPAIQGTTTNWTPNVWVQQEIDNTSAGGTSKVYYDNYNLTAW